MKFQSTIIECCDVSVGITLNSFGTNASLRLLTISWSIAVSRHDYLVSCPNLINRYRNLRRRGAKHAFGDGRSKVCKLLWLESRVIVNASHWNVASYFSVACARHQSLESDSLGPNLSSRVVSLPKRAICITGQVSLSNALCVIKRLNLRPFLSNWC